MDYREQVCEVLKKVPGRDVVVFPQGGQTRELLPRTEGGSLLLLNLARLDRIVKFAPADFYVGCQPGVKLGDLYEKLESAGLKFPFLKRNMRGTVGGMVSCGQIQTDEGCYNISRWVLALEAVLADGSEMKSGAATFKSVAGYDLVKLFCGSFGTLGILTEMTLRCYPQRGGPYGKDLEPVPAKRPRLTANYLSSSGLAPAVAIARKIKHSLDPQGILPVIEGWNSDTSVV